MLFLSPPNMVSPVLILYRILEGTSSFLQLQICSQFYCLGDQSPREDTAVQERTEEGGEWALSLGERGSEPGREESGL